MSSSPNCQSHWNVPFLPFEEAVLLQNHAVCTFCTKRMCKGLWTWRMALINMIIAEGQRHFARPDWNSEALSFVSLPAPAAVCSWLPSALTGGWVQTNERSVLRSGFCGAGTAVASCSSSQAVEGTSQTLLCCETTLVCLDFVLLLQQCLSWCASPWLCVALIVTVSARSQNTEMAKYGQCFWLTKFC